MSSSRVYYIAKETFHESVRSTVFITLISLQLGVILIASIFGMLTIGEQDLVVKDFGMASISLAQVFFIAIVGQSCLPKEGCLQGVNNIWDFVLGRYLGLLTSCAVMGAVMVSLLQLLLIIITKNLDPLIFLACLHLWLECSIICSAVILYASFIVTPVLLTFLTLGLFFAGRSVQHLDYFVNSESPWITKACIEVLRVVLPNLNLITLDILSSNPFKFGSLDLLASSAIYALCYSAALLVVATFFLKVRNKRNFK